MLNNRGYMVFRDPWCPDFLYLTALIDSHLLKTNFHFRQKSIKFTFDEFKLLKPNFYCITISVKTTTKLHHGDRQRTIPSFFIPSLQLCNINCIKIVAEKFSPESKWVHSYSWERGVNIIIVITICIILATNVPKMT